MDLGQTKELFMDLQSAFIWNKWNVVNGMKKRIDKKKSFAKNSSF